MSAEQLKHLWERFVHPKTILQFNPISVFETYERDLLTLGESEARRRRRVLLERNLRTYVQEATGEQTVFPYAVRVLKTTEDLVFSDTQHQDVVKEQAENLANEKDPALREHFAKEHELWLSVWKRLCEDLPEIPLQGRKVTYDNPVDTKALSDLFPVLAGKKKIEVLELPRKVVFASPSYDFYGNGKTTLARHARVVFIPEIQEYAIVTTGLYSGYTDEQIGHIHELGQNPNLPQSKEQLFWWVQEIASAYRDLPPHAVFELLIERLGGFVSAPVGEGVNQSKSRSLESQIEYLERLFDLESEKIAADPGRRKKLEALLKIPTEQVMHSALRAQELEVDALLAAYQDSFLNNSVNLFSANREFGFKSLAIHADFGTRVVSLVDCGTGTILGGANHFDFGKFGEISSRSGLVDFCRQFNKDANLFSQMGRCAMCGRQTFIWPSSEGGCNVCALCEVKDDLGFFDPVSDGLQVSPAEMHHPNLTNDAATIGLSKLVNSWTGVNYY